MRALGRAVFACGVALVPLYAEIASAQTTASTYPVEPIRLIVPFPAGGGVDFIGRIVGQKFLGQQVAIDNRAGANGIVGLEALKSASPDGYTIAAASAGFRDTKRMRGAA